MSQLHSLKNIFITGVPGIGKTTAIKYIVDYLTQCQNNQKNFNVELEIQGFYSEERRVQNDERFASRIGFDIVTIPFKQRSILARIESQLPKNVLAEYQNIRNARLYPMVGKYIVDLPSFENVALPLLTFKDEKMIKNNNNTNEESNEKTEKETEKKKLKISILIVDEIGKMELFSNKFENKVNSCLNDTSLIVIATIPCKNRIPFVERIKTRNDSTLFEITIYNRENITQNIISSLNHMIQKKYDFDISKCDPNHEKMNDSDSNDKNDSDLKENANYTNNNPSYFVNDHNSHSNSSHNIQNVKHMNNTHSGFHHYNQFNNHPRRDYQSKRQTTTTQYYNSNTKNQNMNNYNDD